MKTDLHKCLMPDDKKLDSSQEKPCEFQDFLVKIKVCRKAQSDGCKFFAEHPLGKLEPEDYLFPENFSSKHLCL